MIRINEWFRICIKGKWEPGHDSATGLKKRVKGREQGTGMAG